MVPLSHNTKNEEKLRQSNKAEPQANGMPQRHGSDPPRTLNKDHSKTNKPEVPDMEKLCASNKSEPRCGPKVKVVVAFRGVASV